MGSSISVFVWGLGVVGLVLVYVPGGLGCGWVFWYFDSCGPGIICGVGSAGVCYFVWRFGCSVLVVCLK